MSGPGSSSSSTSSGGEQLLFEKFHRDVMVDPSSSSSSTCSVDLVGAESQGVFPRPHVWNRSLQSRWSTQGHTIWVPTGPEVVWEKFVCDRLSDVTRAEVKRLCESFVEMGFFTGEHFKVLQPRELPESRPEWHMLTDHMFEKVRELLVARVRPRAVPAQPD